MKLNKIIKNEILKNNKNKNLEKNEKQSLDIINLKIFYL